MNWSKLTSGSWSKAATKLATEMKAWRKANPEAYEAMKLAHIRHYYEERDAARCGEDTLESYQRELDDERTGY